MPFYETIFENGRSSVAYAKDDEEYLRGAGEQHRRAKAGGQGGPTGHPAERIVAAYVYDQHPDNYNTADALTADELLKELPNLVKALEDPNGVVSVGRLASEVRALSHPMLRESAPHDSNFKMPEDRVIEADAIEKAAASPSKDGE